MKKVIIGVLVLFIAGLCFLRLIGEGGDVPTRYIVLGDGRAGELAAYADETENIEFVTKSGADVEWLDREALPDVLETADRNTVVLVMTGISDMEHAELYAESLNEWGKRLYLKNGATLCFNSINPVTEGVFTPAAVKEFNEVLRKSLGSNVYYIDTYSEMMEAGFETTDTLHYTEESSELLFKLLMNELAKLDAES